MRAVIVQGLAFGDEGKGSVVDAVCQDIKATLVVRYNGGAQAAHRVSTGGREHVFAQFGAGTFFGASTFLSKYVMIDPPAMEHEAAELVQKGVPLAQILMFIDAECPVLTPYHRAMNRLREIARGAGRHGSCGRGIGELAADLEEYPSEVLRAKDLKYPEVVREKLTAAAHRRRQIIPRLPLPQNMAVDAEMSIFQTDKLRVDRWIDGYKRFSESGVNILRDPPRFDGSHQNIVFEGAQGVLLDQTHGFQPHTTWSDCTTANARELLKDWKGSIATLGVIRGYATRHGAGPFPTEDMGLGITPDPHNGYGDYQGSMRYGHFDAMLLRYALQKQDVDGLAVTHLDTLATWPQISLADSYKYNGQTVRPAKGESPLTNLAHQICPHYHAFAGTRHVDRFLAVVGAFVEKPILCQSWGPTAAGKRWAPEWRELVHGEKAAV